MFSTTTNNVSWGFTLNPASEITSEARTTSASPDPYAYGETQSVSHDYGVNGLNEVVTNASGGTTTNLAYDGNGNLTSDGTNTYTYDVENRLVQEVSGSTTVNLTYDPLGRLLQVDKGTSVTTTKFVYDGDAEVIES